MKVIFECEKDRPGDELFILHMEVGKKYELEKDLAEELKTAGYGRVQGDTEETEEAVSEDDTVELILTSSLKELKDDLIIETAETEELQRALERETRQGAKDMIEAELTTR